MISKNSLLISGRIERCVGRRYTGKDMAIKESEYIIATNRVKISMALTILRDVLPDSEYGITPEELSEVKALLRRHEEKLFSLYETEQ